MYVVLFSKILSGMTCVAQRFRTGDCKPVSLSHFIDEKTDAGRC